MKTLDEHTPSLRTSIVFQKKEDEIMALKKCPRCGLNYIREDQKLCDVCSRKRRPGEDDDSEEMLCIECGEHPAMRGKEICSYCYKESLRQEQLSNQLSSAAVVFDKLEIDDVEVPFDDDEIPENEIDVMDKEFDDSDASDEEFDVTDGEESDYDEEFESDDELNPEEMES